MNFLGTAKLSTGTAMKAASELIIAFEQDKLSSTEFREAAWRLVAVSCENPRDAAKYYERLMVSAGSDVSLETAVRDVYNAGDGRQIIKAIKFYRNKTGKGLRESKEAVEVMVNH